jgi:hypothetical protein
MVTHTCNPTWEAEAGGQGVGDQPGLHSETLSLTSKTLPQATPIKCARNK